MARDEDYAAQYRKEINNMLERGYAERVQDDERKKRWYLPHHGVVNVHKPSKLRVVFDWSAKSSGLSLNDMMLKGPDLMKKLLGVLLRFRCGPIAIAGDIEAMYNQVRVSQTDRNMLCFLFWPDGDSTQKPVVYRMCVHLFGGSWSPCTANYALKRAAVDFGNEVSKATVNTILRNFYVDDCLRACDTVHEACQLVQELTRILSQAGFHLSKWIGNCHEVLSAVPEVDRSTEAQSVKLADGTQHERTLGVRWNVVTDEFSFNVACKIQPNTRRGLLSTVASVYDPMGLACPFVVPAKRLIQELARQEMSWDAPVPDAVAQQWNRWKDGLPMIESLLLPRNIVNGKISDVAEFQLHHFCDASSYAYGAVSYLRSVKHDGSIHCSFVMAKSRLAPIKTVTIPRLELMAATVAVRMEQVIRAELDITISSSTYWSDSQIVLQYIKSSDRQHKVFVANRLSTILCISTPNQWFHVPSEQNPADEVSRGLTAMELVKNERWIFGPRFLQSDKMLAAVKAVPFNTTVSSPDDSEVIPEARIYATVIVENDDNMIDVLIRQFADWYKLKVRTAWILRTKSAFLHGIKKAEKCSSRDITCHEIKEAEVFLLKHVQKRSFPAVIGIGSRNVKIGVKIRANAAEKSIARLDPVFTDSGLLCVGGRLRNAMLLNNEAHPVILPSSHHVTELIIRERHQRSGHVGQEHILALLRANYWILKGRSRIKEVISKCMLCRKRRASLCIQKMADLPRERVSSDHPAFYHVGLDYFGPFEVHIRRSTEKRYGCVFSCMSSRAVHIEVATSLNSSAFINVFRRFIARRGVPAKVFSDNGTNFVGAAREMSEAILSWNSRQTHEYLKQQNIEWNFNPPHASHMGGVWERMIRSIRKVLSGLLRSQRLTDESLNTLMCEAEGILNSRPLTHVSENCENHEALTPNHLLLLRHGPSVPPGEFVKQDAYVHSRWRQVQFLADEFWRRWLHEYLLQLQERQKWVSPQRNVQQGDLVLVVENNAPRGSWPMGRVVDVRRSSDGLVRSASVKTQQGVFDRPVAKLCMLEAATL